MSIKGFETALLSTGFQTENVLPVMKPPRPPYIAWGITKEERYGSDDRDFLVRYTVDAALYIKKADSTSEKALNQALQDFGFTKESNYIDKEELQEVIYTTTILEKL